MVKHFGNEAPKRGAVLSEYQRQARRQPSRWILRIVVAFYLVTLVRGYLEKPDPEELTWSALRMADVELTAASGTEGWPSWVRWLAGLETEEETLAWLAEEMGRLASSEQLTQEGIDVSQLLNELARDEELPSLKKDWEEEFEEELQPWERLAARRQLEGEMPEWWLEQEHKYQANEKKVALIAAAGSGLSGVVFLIGLPFLPAACRCFRPSNHKPIPRVTRAWHPTTITTQFIFVDLLAGWLLSAVYFMIPEGFWTEHFMATIVLTDTFWRLSGPLMLGALLLVRWRHAPRLLGLTKKPVVSLVLGMTSVGYLCDWGLYAIISRFTRAEDLNGLSSLEDGTWGLIFAILSGVILAPIVEEIFFRGVLFQSYLKRFGFGIAMVLSTVFFIVIHYYGFYGSLSVAFFGFGACALYRTTGSLWTAIIFHALANGLITFSMWPLYHGF